LFSNHPSFFFGGKTHAEKMGPQFEEHQKWETKNILSRCGKTIGNLSCFRNMHLAPKPIDERIAGAHTSPTSPQKWFHPFFMRSYIDHLGQAELNRS
jgi:hypothetical protein